MIKKLTQMVLLISFLSMTAFVYAEDVYITKNGKKFHKEVCRFTQNKQVSKIDMAEALAKGLKPCQKCFTSNQVSDNSSKDNQGLNQNKNKKTTLDKT